MKRYIVVACLMCIASISYGAITIYVPGDQPTIQAAIDAANNDDTVLVADGIWTGAGNKDLDFGGKAITVRGNQLHPELCVIDCEGSGRGFYFHNGETSASEVSGFTIKNGAADYGAGIWCRYGSSPTIQSNTIRENTASDDGGGIYCRESSEPLIDGNIITHNVAGDVGGGIYCDSSSPSIVNNVLTRNEARGGAGIYCASTSSPTIAHNTITQNIATHADEPYGGGLFCSNTSVPTVTNTIIWGNHPNAVSGYSPMIITYSDIEGGWPGEGNIDADPLFVDAGNGDFHLTPGSPCIGAGTDAGIPHDIESNPRPTPANSSPDMGAYENPQATPDNEGPLTYDVVANPNPSTVDTDVMLSAIVDDTTTGGSNIASTEYKLDEGIWHPMATGAFDEPSEVVTATISGLGLAGVHTVYVRGTDAAGNTGPQDSILLVVYDPDGGFVTGGGWIQSPPDAYVADPDLTGKVNFGFVSKYRKGASAPIGETEFSFRLANLNFHSDAYHWLVINQNDTNVQYRGEGTINGELADNGTAYHFMIWARDLDPDGVDTFRIKIWYESPEESVVYDNGAAQAISGGNITVHNEANGAPIKPALIFPATVDVGVIPIQTTLLVNYPNPFNPETWIPYQLATDAEVTIRIYRIDGQLVRQLSLGHQTAGYYADRSKAAYWDGHDSTGQRVGSGLYWYQMTAGDFRATRKMVIMK